MRASDRRDVPGRDGDRFPLVLRGYAPEQVHARVSGLELALSQTHAAAQDVESRVMLLERDVTDAAARLRDMDWPTYGELGTGISRMLRLTAQQADDVVALAREEALEVSAPGWETVRSLSNDARNGLASVRETVGAECDRLRWSAAADALTILEAAGRDADATLRTAQRRGHDLRDDAERDLAEQDAILRRDLAARSEAAEHAVDELRAAAAEDVERMRVAARAETDALRAAADEAVVRLHAEAARMRAGADAVLAARSATGERDVARYLDEAAARAAQLADEAERRAAGFEQRAAAELAHADAALTQAEQHAADVAAAARLAGRQLVATAREQAHHALSEAYAEAARIRAVGGQEVSDLSCAGDGPWRPTWRTSRQACRDWATSTWVRSRARPAPLVTSRGRRIGTYAVCRSGDDARVIDEHLYRIHIGPAAEVHVASPEALFLRLLHALQDEGLDFEVVEDASSDDGADPANRHVTVDLAIRLRAGVHQEGSGSVTAGVDRARAALTSGADTNGTRIRDVVVHRVDGVVR